MLGGYLIDADHIIDQLWSIRHGAPLRRPVKHRSGMLKAAGTRAWLADQVRPRKLLRLPLILHSYELLAAVAVLTLALSTPFLLGLLTGYVLHLALDMLRTTMSSGRRCFTCSHIDYRGGSVEIC
jgi:hypothetical protein